MKTFLKPLSFAEEQFYLLQLQRGDPEAKNILIEHNLRLVAHVAKKYQGCDEDQDDLISIGTIGLIKAISTFDPSRTSKLSTYAARCIDNELLMMFRARRNVPEKFLSMNPSAQTGKAMRSAFSISLKVHPLMLWMIVSNGTAFPIFSVIFRTVLSPKEYQVICCRYGLNGQEPLTQREIARNLSISRSYVSRIEKNALEKLRTLFPENQ